MITIEAKNIEYAKAVLWNSPKTIKTAAAAAINRTVTTVKAKISKSIRENYIIKDRDIKSNVSTERASSSNLRGVISSKGTANLITAFRVSPRKKGPVHVQVLKKGSLKPVPGLFIGRSLKGFVGAMQRTKRNARYPLRVPRGPSVPQMFGPKNVMGELVPLAEETLNERFLHEIDHRFNKLGGKQ